ncbi:MAG: PadR family transcriptional regulator [Chloroflexi bacterium]|nr:PadR family transcriptional regulator [Chloroflexota bacterium]
MPIISALLGLLSARPMHGYELLKHFLPGSDLGDLYHLEMGQLYALLHRLEGEELVEAELIPQGTRPPRKVYRLSPQGRAAFQDWVTTPVRKVRDLRIEFLLKLYFARQIGRMPALSLVASQIAVCHQEMERLDGARRSAPEEFARLVYASRVARARGVLEWLESCQRELEVERGEEPVQPDTIAAGPGDPAREPS